MKIFSSDHDISHPWVHVSTALWQKYPNDQTPHVLTVDVLDRRIDAERQVLRTERLLKIRQNIPTFLAKLFSSQEPVSYILEVSEVDLLNKSFRAISTNLSFRDIMVMDETVTYTPDDAQPLARTLMRQEAAVSVNISRFSSYLEDAVLNRFKANAQLGRRGLEEVLDRIRIEGQLGLQHMHLTID